MSKEKQMRDRLIKLLQDNSYLDVLDDEHWLLAADQLLANGVVVIDTDVVSLPNRPLISEYMGRPIDEVINLIRQSEWISVEERLPEESGWYLANIITPFDLEFSSISHYSKGYGWDNPDTVTHWMPLPEAPKNKN